eukprot:XP_011681801.1 PREDICTED: brain protein I3 [Strongylocentrotus purpuratus]
MASGSAPPLYAGTTSKPPPYTQLKEEGPPSYGSIAQHPSYPGQQPAPGYPQQPGFQPQGVPPPPSGTQYYPPQQQPMVARQTTYTTQVVVVGGCPACRVGTLEDDFTLLGLCCAIVFFPLGILCCLAMRQRRCPNCGATFG